MFAGFSLFDTLHKYVLSFCVTNNDRISHKHVQTDSFNSRKFNVGKFAERLVEGFLTEK